jgi:hypothetical protein
MTISSFIKYWLCFILFKDRPRTRQLSNARRDIRYVPPEPMSVDEDPQAYVHLDELTGFVFFNLFCIFYFHITHIIHYSYI